MTFFTQMNQMANTIEARIKELPDGSDERAVECHKRAVLLGISAYIKGGTWTRRKSVVEKLLYSLTHTYKDTSIKYATSENSIKVGVNQLSKRFKTQFSGVLALLEQNSPVDANNLFVIKTTPNAVMSLFPTEVQQEFPEELAYKSFKNKEHFQNCLNVLKNSTTRAITLQLWDCCDDTLGTLLFLLSNAEEEHMPKTLALYGYLSGDFGETELIKRLKS